MNLCKPPHINSCRTLFVIAACILGIVSTTCTTARSVNSEASANAVSINPVALNINIASAAELEKLPHVGRQIALRITEHRERYGPFRRVEHIMLIDGISDTRFREIKDLIKVE